MKNWVFFAAFMSVLAFASCNSKNADSSVTGMGDSSAIVIDYGSVRVDSISPDSVSVTLSDTTVVIQQ
ncbi:MAG: hypothetical protein IJ338_09205 [Bacteroidaceae bacterium]|nr:hypothetical protein [Bacteroidaceae bacterium]